MVVKHSRAKPFKPVPQTSTSPKRLVLKPNGHATSEHSARLISRHLVLQQSLLAKMQHQQSKLKREIEDYERRYQMKSGAVRAAISEGTLRETHEVCRWLIKYDSLERSTPS